MDTLALLLYHTLCSVCAWQCKSLHLPASSDGCETYDYVKLRNQNLVTLCAAQAAAGLERRVTVILVPHRQKDDVAWDGGMCRANHLLVALSSASVRCYALVED